MDKISEYLQQWLRRKTSQRYMLLNEARTIMQAYHDTASPRHLFGEVTLTATPAEDFSFVSKAKWPAVKFDILVLDGILDVLVTHEHAPILGLAVTLDKVGWEQADSAPMGYYLAARQATEKLLYLDNGEPNWSNP